MSCLLWQQTKIIVSKARGKSPCQWCICSFLYSVTPLECCQGSAVCAKIYTWAEGGETPWTGCQFFMDSWWYPQSPVYLTCMSGGQKTRVYRERVEEGNQFCVRPSWVQDDSSEVKGGKCVCEFLTSPLLLETIIFYHRFILYLLCCLTCIKVCVYMFLSLHRRVKSNTLTPKVYVSIPQCPERYWSLGRESKGQLHLNRISANCPGATW